MSEDRVKILNQDVLFDGFNRLTRLVYRYRRIDGAWSDPVEREIFRRGPAAAVLPYDPVRDAVVMVEQFRPGAHLSGDDGWQLEPVAGICETGESPEATVHREALEEAGCRLGRLKPVCTYHVSPGCVEERVSVFCGEVDASGVATRAGDPSEQEETRVQVLAFDDAVRCLSAGRFKYALTILSLQWLALHREALRAEWT